MQCDDPFLLLPRADGSAVQVPFLQMMFMQAAPMMHVQRRQVGPMLDLIIRQGNGQTLCELLSQEAKWRLLKAILSKS
jgi:hypothetical protein